MSSNDVDLGECECVPDERRSDLGGVPFVLMLGGDAIRDLDHALRRRPLEAARSDDRAALFCTTEKPWTQGSRSADDASNASQSAESWALV